VAQLAVQLDPEDLHTVLHPVHAACAAVMAQFDGHMAQQLDDGLVVYFGYPSAHEDAAQRAVRTGLRLLETLQQQPPIVISSQAITLAPRIGIHTGAVVVEPRGARGAPMPVAVGATATIAAALREQAAPGTVVISAATAALVEGYFTWQPLERTRCRAKRRPWRCIRSLEQVPDRHASTWLPGGA
jgi:class 3 adenylate cyclase